MAKASQKLNDSSRDTSDPKDSSHSCYIRLDFAELAMPSRSNWHFVGSVLSKAQSSAARQLYQ